MKFSVLSENINKKLPFIAHAVSSRSQLTTTLNFLIQVKDKELKVSATDLEIGIIGRIPANIEEEGEIAVPAKTLLELLVNVTKGKIDFFTEGETLFVQTSTMKTQIQTQPSKEFPVLYEEKGEEEMVLQKDVFEKEIKKVVFASSQDSGRPALSGVLMEGDGLEKRIVATDGYRLSLKKIKISGGKSKEEQKPIIIPSRMIRELSSLKEEGSISVFILEKSNQILFSQGDVEIVGRLIEAEFPKYEKIIPSDHSSSVEFDKKTMQEAIKTCWVFARETSGVIKMAIEKGKIVVSASTPSVGQGSVDVEVKVTGEENEIAFNGRYLLELLANIDEDTMVFEMNGPLSAGVFKVLGDDSFLHLIMPIRVQE